ncbi:hypothetical protein [Runella salmonicolor]|uniref:Radical SAM superfamily enzyme YgiQ, UPF0313 family n=1 Tax=Runella salmonicolor TaxID=2950278 RepID=A0ABT1FPI1_9BACT|nr:hypothetical protein [Runella salmonicolor]MCP1383680.1 hypothetical protein [Runella salmonicolor]
MRNILLIEPNYSNKYPPIGLMKIATYHRMLGDKVRYFKGDLKDLVIDELWKDCLNDLNFIDNSINWNIKQAIIKKFIKTKNSQILSELNLEESKSELLIISKLDNYADIFRKKIYTKSPKFDRIYVTTLFTFYWKITVETIEFCKKLVKNPKELHVGGVLASLLHEELEKETGIKPMKGLLDKPGILDPGNPRAKSIVIDNLPLDYSILDEIDYEYPTRSAYFTFMTKGCTRKCSFCSVPILEPTYKPKIETIDKFMDIKERFGDQQNLLLMDNNVLASPKFLEIIDEIKAMGFYKGATFIEPNQLEIAIKNLQSGYNDNSFMRRAFRLLHELVPRLKKEVAQTYYNVLAENNLLDFDTTTKEGILKAYPQIEVIYEKFRLKSPKLRYVDFNQGTDCRYVTEEIMQKMSEIPIRPLRIAFDYIGLKKQYVAAVKLAAKYGIKELSNYILYNFQDKPEDLYERLKINVELCKELDIAIFSFPMKYIPLFGEEAKHREFTGTHWNKKYIRAIQSILNVTKGIVAPANKNEKTSFFEAAFGKNLEEFFEILYMPETYIVYRYDFRDDDKIGYTPVWKNEYQDLKTNYPEEWELAKKIIHDSKFTEEIIGDTPLTPRVKHFLRHYTIPRGSIERSDTAYQKLKAKYDKLIKEDQFIDLTLTYDFETSNVRRLFKSTSIRSRKVDKLAISSHL